MLTPTVSCAQIDATMPRTRNHADDNAQVLLPSENALGARTHAALRQSHSLCRSSPRALDLHSSNISYSLTIGAHMNNLGKIGRGGICAMTKQHVLDVVIVVEVNPPRATLGEQCDSTLSTVRDSASRYLEYARDHRSLIATDRFRSRAAIH